MEQQMQPSPMLASSQQEESPNYVWMGVIIGLVVALVIVGGIYYKMKIDLLTAQNKKTYAPPAPVTPTPEPPSFFGSPTTSSAQLTVTPVKIQSTQDLVKQDIVLDDMDLASLSSELEKNTAAAVDFSQ